MQKFPVGSKVRIIWGGSAYTGSEGKVVGYNATDLYPYKVAVSPFQTCTFKEKELEQIIGAVDEATKPVAITNSNGGIKFDGGKTVVNERGGIKNFGGKIQPRLLFQSMPEAVEEVISVLTYGANKYSADNWKKVDDFAYHDAFQRHYLEYCKGEKLDKDSGKEHLAHMICSLFFLLQKSLES